MSTFAEERSLWRTSSDVREGVVGNAIGTVTDIQSGNRFVIGPDDDKYSTILVDTDAVTTRWNGFGGTINGSPEIFVGSAGFPNLRTGDRVDVRGVGRGVGNVRADTVTLLGRPVEAPQTGVGQTRDPGNISTPTASATTPTTSPDRLGRVDGIVRQVNAAEGRVVIETDNRALMTVRATSTTPVRYRGNTYRIANLEQGDRIRIEPESGTVGSGGEIRARSIEVIQSARESGGSPSRQVGNLTGRVTRVDRANNRVTIDSGRGPVVIDLANALDGQGRRVRATDVMAGDHLDVTGTYTADTFVATVVRWSDDSGGGGAGTPAPGNAPPTGAGGTGYELGTVTIYGTVSQTLRNSPQLIVRDSAGHNVRLYVVDDFAVKTRSGGYTTADKLNQGDSVAVRAYRDADGNFIAQTIRVR